MEDLARPRDRGAVARPGISSRTSTRADGDFAIDGDPIDLATCRTRLVGSDLPWVWLRQVHGARVIVVDRGTAEATCGAEADALVTADAGLVLAVQSADCAPVVLWS